MKKFLLYFLLIVLGAMLIYQSRIGFFKRYSYSCSTYSGCVNSNQMNSATKIINGSARIEKETFDHLTVNGSATLDEVSVQEAVINGLLRATKCMIKKLKVNGSAHLAKSIIAEDTHIAGSLEADESSFDSLTLISTYSRLIDSQVKAIVVQKTYPTTKVQQIELVNSIVKGDIRFESGDGEVILKQGARIEGQVIGGRIL